MFDKEIEDIYEEVKDDLYVSGFDPEFDQGDRLIEGLKENLCFGYKLGDPLRDFYERRGNGFLQKMYN